MEYLDQDHPDGKSHPATIQSRQDTARYVLGQAAAGFQKFLAELLDPGPEVRKSLLEQRKPSWTAHLLPLPFRGTPAESAVVKAYFAMDLTDGSLVLLNKGQASEPTQPLQLEDYARLYTIFLVSPELFDIGPR